MDADNVYALERIAHNLYKLISSNDSILAINLSFITLYSNNKSNGNYYRYSDILEIFYKMENLQKRLTTLLDTPFLYLTGEELVSIIETISVCLLEESIQ